MKALIITMHRPINYGSYLQATATYKFVKNNGFDVDVIDYLYPNAYHQNNSYNFKREKREREENEKQVVSLKKRVYEKIGRYLVRPNNTKKMTLFSEFYKKHITLTREYGSLEDLIACPPVADVYITGSDQVWNPLFTHHDTSFMFSWAPRSAKRISYSASISISDLPDEFVDDFKTNLSKYSFISTRENTDIIKKLIGKNSVDVLDPTFLLSSEEWKKYCSPKPLVEGKYILCYLLEYSFSPFPFAYTLIEYIRKKTGYKVVMIDGECANVLKGYKVFANNGPAEFLNLFLNASFVITNSFHGTAFSLNFHKQFLAITNNQPTKDFRVRAILEKLAIRTECEVKNASNIETLKLPNLDYSVIGNKLECLRNESKKFFKNALKSNS